MNEFHPNEKNVDVPMDGKADMIMQRRSAIKLSTGPRIMVAIPIGGKALSSVLECPSCKADGKEKSKYIVNSGFTAQAHVPFQFMMQHMNWLPPLNVTMGYEFKSGMLSAAARQIMTQEAKRYDTVKYIFYVDDDMIIPSLGLYTLYNLMEQHPDWGAVSGIYTTRQEPPEPLIYTAHGEGAAWDFEMGEGANPTKIMGAGAGCLLARVEAIKDWEAANPDTPIWCDSSEFPASNDGRVTWGHDVRFVRNLTEAGWDCYADGRVLCGHYDAATNKVFSVPANAPGLKKRNVNTSWYWDAVYGNEGFDTWRTYDEMYSYIIDHVNHDGLMDIIELGCGPGVLGQRMTATVPCSWKGFDISEVAVAQAKARYLNAHVKDLRGMDFEDCHYIEQAIIGTELLEHLTWDDCSTLLGKLNGSGAGQLIFSTPWECMPPEEVKEHMVLVNQEWLDGACEVLSRYELSSSEKVDEHHRVHIWCRKD